MERYFTILHYMRYLGRRVTHSPHFHLPTWSGDVIRWCFDAAKERGMKQEDFMGGFIIDEMKIQVNLKH